MRRIERGELRADRVRACLRLGAESSTLDAPDRRGTLAAHRTFPLARRPVRRRAHGTVDIPFPPRVPHRAALGMPVWSRVRSHSAASHRIACGGSNGQTQFPIDADRPAPGVVVQNQSYSRSYAVHHPLLPLASRAHIRSITSPATPPVVVLILVLVQSSHGCFRLLLSAP